MNKTILVILVLILADCKQSEDPSALNVKENSLEVKENSLKVEAMEVAYTRLTPTAFREWIAEAPIAYLPLGTLEWYGEHLPLGSDGLQSSSFMTDLAREAGGIVLPMLYLGPDMRTVQDEKELYGMDYQVWQAGIHASMPAPSRDKRLLNFNWSA